MNKRVGRPIGTKAERTKVHMAITIDSDISEWLQKAEPGSKSRYINDLLRQARADREGR